MNMLFQKCVTCKQELPLDSFCKNIRSANGYNYQCKSCVKVYQLSIKDKLKAYQHEYQKVYQANHREELDQYNSEWRKKYPEKCRAYTAKSNAKRADAKKAYEKAYQAANREKIAARMKQYRLRKKLEKQQNGE